MGFELNYLLPKTRCFTCFHRNEGLKWVRAFVKARGPGFKSPVHIKNLGMVEQCLQTALEWIWVNARGSLTSQVSLAQTGSFQVL